MIFSDAVMTALETLVVKHGEEAAVNFLAVVTNHAFQPVGPTVQRAWDLTHGDRRTAYGTPAQVFAGYAKMWSGLLATKLKADLTAADIALCMTALKLAREANAPQADNIVDAHGYLILLDEIK